MENGVVEGLGGNLLVFFLCAGVITAAGTKMAELGDRLADRTGLGEAVTGTLLLGFSTALPGIAASMTAAVEGYPAMAVSNAFGGIAVQTTFLAIADVVYRKANLEHAAASVTNMMQAAILILLMTLVLMALSGPDITFFHIHPVTPVMFIAAGFGFRLVNQTGERPMWHPRWTAETVTDVPQSDAKQESLWKLGAGFILTAALLLTSGAVVADAAGKIAVMTGISESVMGGLLLAVTTSLPELVVTVAAVRMGALTLAVSDIVGGNFFDALFVCLADLVYFKGSLYHAAGVGNREIFLVGLTIFLNTLLLMGMIYRQKRGFANIGFESLLILLLYVGGFLTLSFLM